MRLRCPRKILVAFVYIYCLLECFSVWVSSVSCRNVGVFSSAIRLVARELTTLAVFYLHVLMRWFKFCFTLCSEFHSSFLIVVKNDLTYYADIQ